MFLIQTGKSGRKKTWWKGFNPHGLPMSGIGKGDALRYKTREEAIDACITIPWMVGPGEVVEEK